MLSYTRVYSALKFCGLCFYVWPFPWKNRIHRKIAKIIYCYAITMNIFVLLIPISVFVLFNIRDDTVKCIGTAIIGLIGLEANACQVYCKVKNNQYKVRGLLIITLLIIYRSECLFSNTLLEIPTYYKIKFLRRDNRLHAAVCYSDLLYTRIQFHVQHFIQNMSTFLLCWHPGWMWTLDYGVWCKVYYY